jgi:hypothetical protein
MVYMRSEQHLPELHWEDGTDGSSKEKWCAAGHSVALFGRFIMAGVNRRIHLAREGRLAGYSSLASAVLMCLLPAVGWALGAAKEQTRDVSTEHTTVVIFADRSMQQEQWSALFGALRTGVVDEGRETAHLDAAAEFMRGDSVVPGMSVQTAIVVYLHGDCNLAPLARRTAYGVPLGWVRRANRRIEPFVHVDCTRIGQVLGPQALGMGPERRNAVMAGAMARVIVHEWIHIATQNSAHSKHGVEKAQFGIEDLLAGQEQPVEQLRKPW